MNEKWRITHGGCLDQRPPFSACLLADYPRKGSLHPARPSVSGCLFYGSLTTNTHPPTEHANSGFTKPNRKKKPDCDFALYTAENTANACCFLTCQNISAKSGRREATAACIQTPNRCTVSLWLWVVAAAVRFRICSIRCDVRRSSQTSARWGKKRQRMLKELIQFHLPSFSVWS